MSVKRYQIVSRIIQGKRFFAVLAIMSNDARKTAATFGSLSLAEVYVNAAINARKAVIHSLNSPPIEDYANEKY